MILRSLLLSSAYLLLLFAILPILKRRYSFIVSRQVIFPAFLLSLYLYTIYYLDLLTESPSSDSSITDRVLWIGIVVLGVYSFNQLAIWLTTELLIRPGRAKIPRFLLNIIGGLILATAVLLTLRLLFDVELSGILLTSTVASAIIGFSIQDILGNLFAGVALQIEAPFAIDDWVEIGGHEGQVLSQNWRSLMLLTRENHRISLTNRYVASDKIVNYSRPTQRQIQIIYLSLDYSHPPNQVKQILIEFLNSVEECEYDPNVPPFVAGFDDYAIRYGLRFWIKDYGDIIKIQDLVYTRLWYIFKREGIKIPFPTAIQYEFEAPMKLQDEGEFLPIDIPKLLESFDLLDGLEEGQIDQLAQSAVVQIYTAGEVLVHEGHEGDSMFMVTKGVADVTISGDYGQQIHVQSKKAGEIFGEMSLLTGEPRSATIRAKTDVEAILIRKEEFTSVLMQDPSILNVLLDGLEAQKSNLQSQRLGQNGSHVQTKKSSRELLLQNIWSYLGLEFRK
ncbi:MAG: mechanosensitive ion channel family protein [Chloroflexota bacterium]